MKKQVYEYAGQDQTGVPLYAKRGSRIAYVTTGCDGMFTRLFTQQGDVVGLGLAMASEDIGEFNLSDDLWTCEGVKL